MALRLRLFSGKRFSNILRWTFLNSAFDDGYAEPVSGTLGGEFIAAESITETKLADGAVVTAKIADEAVTVGKLNPAVVGAGLEVDGAALQVAIDGTSIDVVDGKLHAVQQFDVDTDEFDKSEDTPPVISLKDAGITLPKLADGILSADEAGRAKMAVDFITPAMLAGVPGIIRICARGAYAGNGEDSKTLSGLSSTAFLVMIWCHDNTYPGINAAVRTPGANTGIFSGGAALSYGATPNSVWNASSVTINATGYPYSYHGAPINRSGFNYSWVAFAVDNEA